MVVRTPLPSGRSLVSVAVATWAAYNHWGGYSAYSGPDGALASRSYEVRLDRPLDAKVLSVVLAYEYPAATFIDRVLPDAAWTTGLDVALGRTSLTRVRQYVSTGHDEYWPVAQRRAVEAALDRGTNLFFMGANAVYWRIRLGDGPRASGFVRRTTATILTRFDRGPAANNVELAAVWKPGRLLPGLVARQDRRWDPPAQSGHLRRGGSVAA